jgi:hypothetical protein
MFEAATQALELVRAELAGLDARCLGGQEAVALLGTCARLSGLAQAGAIVAAGRVAASEPFRAAPGRRTARGLVSDVCGISVSAAEAMIDLAERLERFPATAALLVTGTISPAEADQVTRASARNAEAERSLLDTARAESFSRLKEAAKAVQSPDPDDDRRRAEEARRARSVRTWIDAEGMGHLHAKGPADLIGILAGRIATRAEDFFGAARSCGDHQAPVAYCFDALVDLICGIPPAPGGCRAHGCGPDDGGVDDSGSPPDPTLFPSGEEEPRPPGAGPPDRGGGVVPGAGPPRRASPRRVDMIIRIDFAALRRGYVQSDDICEVAGVGPVPVAAATEYLGEAALKFVLTEATDIKAVAHAGRHVNAHLRTALLWKYRRCSAPGCDRALGLQRDHQFPVGKGGITALDNLQFLCAACHAEKTKRDYPDGTAHLRRRRDRDPAPVL